MSASHLAELGEDGSCTYPGRERVAFPHVLAKLDGGFYHVLVTISSLVISAQGIAASCLCHHAPRGIAKVECGTKVLGQYGSSPGLLVGVELQFGGAEGIVVAHEARTEHLGEVHVITPVGIGEVVTVVEHEGESHAIVVGMSVHSRQELGALDVLADDVVVGHGRTEKEVAAKVPQEASLHVHLPSLHVALVVVVVAHVVSHSPELAGEGIEVERVDGTVTVVGEDVGSAHTEQIEAHRADIAKERHIGGEEERVGWVGAIDACCH